MQTLKKYLVLKNEFSVSLFPTEDLELTSQSISIKVHFTDILGKRKPRAITDLSEDYFLMFCSFAVKILIQLNSWLLTKPNPHR